MYVNERNYGLISQNEDRTVLEKLLTRDDSDCQSRLAEEKNELKT